MIGQFVKKFNAKIVPVYIERENNTNFKITFQNPMEFSTTKVIARPLPKYVTEAKQKFVFGDDDHEMMECDIFYLVQMSELKVQL